MNQDCNTLCECEQKHMAWHPRLFDETRTLVSQALQRIPPSVNKVHGIQIHNVRNPSPRPHTYLHRPGMIHIPIFSIPRIGFPDPPKFVLVAIKTCKIICVKRAVHTPDQRHTPAASSTFSHTCIPAVDVNQKLPSIRLARAMARILPPTNRFDHGPNSRT